MSGISETEMNNYMDNHVEKMWALQKTQVESQFEMSKCKAAAEIAGGAAKKAVVNG